MYGAMLYGMMEFGDAIGPWVGENSLAKAALGPNLLGNGMNAVFFYNDAIGEKNEYSIPKLLDNYKAFWKEGGKGHKFIENISRKEYMRTVLWTLTFWNAFQYANYEVVPDELRTAAVLATSIPWMTFLTVLSLKGSRKVVDADL